ncbi:MarR family transcriptional regulator [Arcicella sp. LKC2W]|uniref:MarR family winged helix-turn-helix transcriptional regulator n=1 Tax=Arcicella sp. LKC2W TaxID=2984198 RepID=UPI002B221653|nr:MarR family transcriptional regulator [Arcicella sp. LKC2W]MEA5459775.1 MarR family transcriptional regulator [Arcicella sp. LKC2W]
MSIEKDIQQNSFKSTYSKAVINIFYTNNWLTSLQMEIFKPFDLTPQQYNVLRILRGQYPEPITVIAIIERMLDKMSNASRLVDKLLAKELVIRKICPNDRRAVDVIITQKGLDLLAELDVLQQKWEQQLHGLSECEANQLSFLLDKLRNSDPSNELEELTKKITNN